MTNELHTASVPVWQPPRIAQTMLVLIRMLLTSRRVPDAPSGGEWELAKGCAFAVRYTSPPKKA